MNNPISQTLRRPSPAARGLETSGNLMKPVNYTISNFAQLRKESSAESNVAKSDKSEKYEWECEPEQSADWLSEAADIFRLTLLAPISSIELVGKSLPGDCPSESAAKGSHKQQPEELDWGSGHDWLEEISHVLRLSVSAPVNCVELLSKSLGDSEDDKITI
jgi:hypothetical protein